MSKTLTILVVSFSFFVLATNVYAQSPTQRKQPSVGLVDEDTEIASDETELFVTEQVTPTSIPRPDLTKESQSTIEPLEQLLADQYPGSWLVNPIKHAIRNAVSAGVPPNTIILLLLLPTVAAIIAGTRHLVGIRGLGGIFLPAALSVVFLAIGPIVGIGLFLVIVAVSTGARIVLRRSKVKLQYLPRMSLLLQISVMGVLLVLFLAPIIQSSGITGVSIFPILILVLLSDEFSRIQLGKSAKTAVNLTTETLILALISFAFMTLSSVQRFALLHPEALILIVMVMNVLLGKYVGLRAVELYRFKKIISK